MSKNRRLNNNNISLHLMKFNNVLIFFFAFNSDDTLQHKIQSLKTK